MQQQLTGLDMVQIDIANSYGMDKEDWMTRLLWCEVHENQLEEMISTADEPLMYIKAVMAYRDAQAGIPSGHNMFLDATASGLQILAALSGCKKTAKHVNMINTGNREDVYIEVATAMNKLLPDHQQVDRSLVKKPVMTHYYNKIRQDILSEEQENAFYTVLAESFEGAEAVKDYINTQWNRDALEHQWTLPDGHVSRVLVTEMKTARIEVDELNHTTFAYRFECNEPSSISSSLVPNIVHSIDGYIVREMIRKAHSEDFQLAHIFDAFTAHPNHMVRVTEMYREVLADIASSNLLQDIMDEIRGEHKPLIKFSNDLDVEIMKSEYMLS